MLLNDTHTHNPAAQDRQDSPRNTKQEKLERKLSSEVFETPQSPIPLFRFFPLPQ